MAEHSCSGISSASEPQIPPDEVRRVVYNISLNRQLRKAINAQFPIYLAIQKRGPAMDPNQGPRRCSRSSARRLPYPYKNHPHNGHPSNSYSISKLQALGTSKEVCRHDRGACLQSQKLVLWFEPLL